MRPSSLPRPMLAVQGELPRDEGWAFELKWDGVRALAIIAAGTTRFFARSGAEITRAYPELAGLGAALADAGVTDAIIDGEVVLLDRDGRPSFMALASRMHVRADAKAQQLATTIPVTFMIFDVLRANGGDITSVPYAQRREWLESTIGTADHWLVPPAFTDGPATVEASRTMALEGVVAKRLASAYRPGQRSPDWVKIKHESTVDYVVGGWKSERRALSSLFVGAWVGPGRLDYRGRVGGGISATTERELLALLTPLRAAASPFPAVPREDARGAVWVRPEVVVEIRYGELTPDKKLRFPVFRRLRPDKTPAETAEQPAEEATDA